MTASVELEERSISAPSTIFFFFDRLYLYVPSHSGRQVHVHTGKIDTARRRGKH